MGTKQYPNRLLSTMRKEGQGSSAISGNKSYRNVLLSTVRRQALTKLKEMGPIEVKEPERGPAPEVKSTNYGLESAVSIRPRPTPGYWERVKGAIFGGPDSGETALMRFVRDLASCNPVAGVEILTAAFEFMRFRSEELGNHEVVAKLDEITRLFEIKAKAGSELGSWRVQ